MCRDQLPVWQREWPGLKTRGARLVAVAVDAEVESVRRHARGLDYPVLVDTTGQLAGVMGFRAIPNGYLFARDGTLLAEKVPGFDIRRPDSLALLKTWLAARSPADAPSETGRAGGASPRALELFAEGTRLLDQGQRRPALARLHAAYLADTKSFVIRKQIWRALYPDRFGDSIDTAWQREQIAREDSQGFGAANPGLPAPEV